MLSMTREQWQGQMYRHTMRDGSPALLHMADDGATVLELVTFTDHTVTVTREPDGVIFYDAAVARCVCGWEHRDRDLSWARVAADQHEHHAGEVVV